MLQLSEHVWLWPPDPDPDLVRAGVGIVRGRDGCLLVDAGQSPAHARRVRHALEEAGFPPVRRIVYTHAHWDHTWGGQVWDAPATGHRLCAEAMLAEAAKPWSRAYAEAEMARDPLLVPSYTARLRAVDDWDELRQIPPETTFEHALDLDVGGIAVELRHVGGPHTAESVVVGVPGERVLFLGDCYFPPPYHLRSPGDVPGLDLLARLLDPGIRWYVDSHSPPMPHDDLSAYLATR